MSAQPDPEYGVQPELADSRTVAHERARLVGIFLIFFSSGPWVYKHYQSHKIILCAHARTHTNTHPNNKEHQPLCCRFYFTFSTNITDHTGKALLPTAHGLTMTALGNCKTLQGHANLGGLHNPWLQRSCWLHRMEMLPRLSLNPALPRGKMAHPEKNRNTNTGTRRSHTR